MTGLLETLIKLGFVHERMAEGGWGNLYKWEPDPAARTHAGGGPTSSPPAAFFFLLPRDCA